MSKDKDQNQEEEPRSIIPPPRPKKPDITKEQPIIDKVKKNDNWRSVRSIR